jgi:hypothetical protein
MIEEEIDTVCKTALITLLRERWAVGLLPAAVGTWAVKANPIMIKRTVANEFRCMVAPLTDKIISGPLTRRHFPYS